MVAQARSVPLVGTVVSPFFRCIVRQEAASIRPPCFLNK